MVPNRATHHIFSFKIEVLFQGPEFLCKMLPCENLNENLYLNKFNFFNAIKYASGNFVGIICDGNRVNQGFF